MEGLSSAVGFAAKLKPELRLIQAISEFNASLSNKNQRAKFKNLQSQSPPSPDDIIRLTEEINRDGARVHRSWRPYGTRLVAILERMRQFAPIGDVLVGGSQNLIACGVWAVVRLSLETSLSFLSYFENVTNMMMRLGRSLSLHQDFAMLFPRCSTLQSYMCEYTIVMVNICAKIVQNCAKSALSQFATSFTSTFDAAFKPLESDLASWAQLIEKRATVLLAKADLQNQSSVLERFNRLHVSMSRESTIQQKETRKHRLLTALCPYQGDFNLIWRRERKRGTSSWMYEQDAYKSWLSSEVESVLWLKGNLGSGKTVTMASAVAHLTLAAPSMDPQGAVTVSYFFCQSNNPRTLSASSLLGSIVGQVLQSPALAPSLTSFLEQLEVTPGTHAMPEEYIDILLKATPSNWRGIFVLDGLDEMPQEEVEDIFTQFHRLGEHRLLSLLCSSRPTSACYSIAKSIMDEMWTVSMETVDRSEEIRAYLTAEISRWNTIRPLPPELKRLVEEQLLVGCQGMLLWLSLQLEDICPRHTQELRSDAEILDILGTLPKSLPGAFDKALSQMHDGKYGRKLFKLVASAEPPLSMDELRVAFNVDPGNTKWDNSTLFGSGKALVSAYGASLLDIDEEDLRVRFIHYSVLLHLTAPSSDAKTSIFHFDLVDTEHALGAVCVTYLNYSVFENRISTAQKVSFGHVPQTTAKSVIPSQVSRKALSLLSKHRRPRGAKVDLERLSYDLQNERWKVRDDVHLFLEYAQGQWLSATRNILTGASHGVFRLWGNLISGSTASVSLPWDSGSVLGAATWALCNGHAALFQYYLHSNNEDFQQSALLAAVSALSSGVSSIRLQGGGLGWLAPLYLMHRDYQAVVLQAYIELGCQPLNAALPVRGFQMKAPTPNLAGPAVIESAQSHLLAALRSHSRGRDAEISVSLSPSDSYCLFLANYLSDLNLVLDDQSTILHLALQSECLPLASELLSRGADPDGRQAKGHPTPLQISLKKGFKHIAQRLINLGAHITANPDDGPPPLFLAIDLLDLGLFHSLVIRGAHMRKTTYEPNLETPFHRLCRNAPPSPLALEDSAMALKILLQHGAYIDSRNAVGETPLIVAVRMEKWWLVWRLLWLGANPNIGDRLGARPLHYAADLEPTESLLNAGADPNTSTVDSGVRPLMVAAHRGYVSNVDNLLGKGANPSECLIKDITTEEALLLDWVEEEGLHPGSDITALHLCSQRLEWELRDPKHISFGKTGALCANLLSIITKLLQHHSLCQPRYLDVLVRLQEVLSRPDLVRILPPAKRQEALEAIKAVRANLVIRFK